MQDFLNGWIRRHLKTEELPEFFLRGFLLCPQCGKKLTGSTSSGRKKYYSYYHCYRSCNYRIDDTQANKIVKKELSKFIPFMEIGLLFSETLAYEYQQQTKDTSGAKFGLLSDIRTAEEKLTESLDWLFNGRLSPEDYSELKKELTQRIEQLERKLGAIPTEPVNLIELLEKGIRNLLALDDAINQQDTGRSRVIIGSIYLEKFTIVEKTFRTAKVNEAVELIYRLGKGYSRLQKTKKEAKTSLLSWVDPPGLEPGTL